MPVFNIAGPCQRHDAIRGVALVRMDSASILSNGIYMQGAQVDAVCLPRGAQPG